MNESPALDPEREKLLRQLTQLRLEHARLANQMEKMLAEQSASQDAALDFSTLNTLDVMVGWFDQNLDLAFANAHWCAFTGRSCSELVGNQWLECVHPMDRAELKHRFAETLRQTSNCSVTLRLLNNEGHYHWIELHLKPWGADGKKNRGHIGQAVDINERRVAEERLKLVAEGSGLGFWDLDLNSGTLAINELWAGILGLNFTEIRPSLNWWRELIHPEDVEMAMNALRAHVYGKEDIFQREIRMRHSEGSWRWILVKGRVVEWSTKGHPRRAAGTIMDITLQIQLQNDQRRFQSKMQEAQKLESIGVLAGGIAHDFNNLLMGILGNADLAINRLAPDDETRPCLDAIVNASTRAAELCRELLAYSGRGRFIVEPLHLNDIIKDMYNLLEVSISKYARVQFELESRLPAIEADATQIRQVVMNLLTNASEAIGPVQGTITLKTWSEFKAQEDLASAFPSDDLQTGLYVFLAISDSGCGMTKSTLARMFDPFFTTKAHGRGLGMAAVRGIMRSHGGAISVESDEGQGTRIQLLLPATELEPSLLREDPVEMQEVTGGTILLVDDEQLVTDATSMMLRDRGFGVITASNGAQGIEKYQANREKIDLVIMDLAMPVMGGEEALKRLEAIDPGVKVLLTSGYNEHDSITDFTRDKILGFIQKPYQSQQLIKAILKVMSNGQRSNT